MNDVDVMLLCAGLGTRLRPLTLELAKPAVPLLNRPLVGYSLALARTIGADRATINTHWLPETMRAAAEEQSATLKIQLSVSHEPDLLGTGGGLWQARERGLLRRDADVLVLNGDVLFDVDLEKVIQAHRESSALATMVLRAMPTGASYSPIQVDADGYVRRIGKYGAATSGPAWLFTGVHVLSPEALDLLPAGASGVVETVYAPLLARGAPVRAVFEEGLWLDLGDPDGYLGAHIALLSGTAPLGAFARHGILPPVPSSIATDAAVDSTARVSRSAVGSRATIAARARVEDSVVWPGAHVGEDEHLIRTIVTPKTRVAVR